MELATGESSCSAVKLAKLEEKPIDDIVTQRRNLELIKNCKVGSISGKTFSSLVGDTFPARRAFIQEQAKSCVEIIDMCPYLGKVENVSSINSTDCAKHYNSIKPPKCIYLYKIPL
jgi:hypothetical protein